MEIQNPAKLRISPGKGASDDLGKVATASRMQLGLHLGRNFTRSSQVAFELQR